MGIFPAQLDQYKTDGDQHRGSAVQSGIESGNIAYGHEIAECERIRVRGRMGATVARIAFGVRLKFENETIDHEQTQDQR